MNRMTEGKTGVRSLDLLASKCRIHESTNHSQGHGFAQGHGRVWFTHQQPTDSNAPWSVTSEVPTFNPSQRWSSSDKITTNSLQKTEDATLRRTTRKKCGTWHVVVGTSAVLRMILEYCQVQFICRVPHALRTRLTHVIVGFGTALLVSPQLSTPPPAVIRAARTAGFNSTWLVFSGLPRTSVHGAVTSTLESHLDLPILSSCLLRSTPRLSSSAHDASNPSSRGK